MQHQTGTNEKDKEDKPKTTIVVPGSLQGENIVRLIAEYARTVAFTGKR